MWRSAGDEFVSYSSMWGGGSHGTRLGAENVNSWDVFQRHKFNICSRNHDNQQRRSEWLEIGKYIATSTKHHFKGVATLKCKNNSWYLDFSKASSIFVRETMILNRRMERHENQYCSSDKRQDRKGVAILKDKKNFEILYSWGGLTFALNHDNQQRNNV